MNKIDLAGRVAVVTGGARGIGLALAQRAMASGATVVLWDRDADRLAQAVGTLAGCQFGHAGPDGRGCRAGCGRADRGGVRAG